MDLKAIEGVLLTEAEYADALDVIVTEAEKYMRLNGLTEPSQLPRRLSAPFLLIAHHSALRQRAEARVKELEAALEHEHINRGFMEDVSGKRGEDAGFWYDQWQACTKDLMQALTYGVHYGDCQWVGGPDDTCICGLFALMKKYALPTGDNSTESDTPSDKEVKA